MTVISYDRFLAEMSYLHKQGYRSLGMHEIVRFLKGGKFPAKVVAIQFDDGWQSALNVLPVLDRYGFKATFWIIGNSPGSGPLFMDWPVLQDLDRNPRYKVFSHTMTHPYQAGNTLIDWIEGKTAGKSAADARRELSESKRLLEQHLGHRVPYLNWPAGIFNDALIDMAKEAGYTAIVTTTDGVNYSGGDIFRIHRTVVEGACGMEAFRGILSDGRYRNCGAQK